MTHGFLPGKKLPIDYALVGLQMTRKYVLEVIRESNKTYWSRLVKRTETRRRTQESVHFRDGLSLGQSDPFSGILFFSGSINKGHTLLWIRVDLQMRDHITSVSYLHILYRGWPFLRATNMGCYLLYYLSLLTIQRCESIALHQKK